MAVACDTERSSWNGPLARPAASIDCAEMAAPRLCLAAEPNCVAPNRPLARKRDRVGQTVARSPVAEGAKKLARSGHVLESRFSKFVVEAVKFVGTLLSGLVPSPLRRLLGQIIWQCRQAVSLVLGFFGRWFRTRHYWHLLGGLPAFLLALPLAYCMIRMPFYTADHKVKHYRRAAEEAMLEKDFTTADLYYRKLYQLGATSDAVDYQSAINSIESGDDRGRNRTAQATCPGRSTRFRTRSPVDLPLVPGRQIAPSIKPSPPHWPKSILEFVLDRDPGNVEARALRARHLQIAGRWNDAASELQQVVKQMPERGLNLAEDVRATRTLGRRATRSRQGPQDLRGQGRESGRNSTPTNTAHGPRLIASWGNRKRPKPY